MNDDEQIVLTEKREVFYRQVYRSGSGLVILERTKVLAPGSNQHIGWRVLWTSSKQRKWSAVTPLPESWRWFEAEEEKLRSNGWENVTVSWELQNKTIQEIQSMDPWGEYLREKSEALGDD